jgi:hypothetical protein
MTMTDVHSQLFLHLLKRGLDRAYAAVDLVSRENPDVGLGVNLILLPEELEAADWTQLGDRTHLVFAGADAAGEIDCVEVPLNATRHAMEQDARALARGLASRAEEVES